MKETLVLLSTFIFSISSCQNNSTKRKEFEGKITYEVYVRSKTNKISTDDLQKIYGTRMTKYFKDGNFRMDYNGEDIKTIYFLKNDNTEFDLRNGIDTLFATTYDQEDRKLTKSTFDKSETIIVSRKCNLLIHQIENTTNYYWYDPSIYIDPKNYVNSKFSFTNIYFEQSKSPWLKYKYDGENIEINYTAIEISKEEINKNLFELPALPMSYYR